MCCVQKSFSLCLHFLVVTYHIESDIRLSLSLSLRVTSSRHPDRYLLMLLSLLSITRYFLVFPSSSIIAFSSYSLILSTRTQTHTSALDSGIHLSSLFFFLQSFCPSLTHSPSPDPLLIITLPHQVLMISFLSFLSMLPVFLCYLLFLLLSSSPSCKVCVAPVSTACSNTESRSMLILFSSLFSARRQNCISRMATLSPLVDHFLCCKACHIQIDQRAFSSLTLCASKHTGLLKNVQRPKFGEGEGGGGEGEFLSCTHRHTHILRLPTS